jgi:MFS family permease
MDQTTPPEEMLKKRLKPARTALHVLALCFALSVIGRGLGESFTVFLKPISESFGWDRAQVVSVYSLTALAGGLAAPLVGRLFDRSGPRAVYSLGMFLLGAAFLIAAHAQYLWQFQLSIGLCVGVGIAFIGNVPNSILLGRWFGARLPTAMAVVFSAAGGGVLLLLPASQILIDHLGWRGAYQIFGIAVLCLMVPLLLLPWRLFSGGSAARPQEDRSGLHRSGLDGAERDAPPRVLGFVLDLLLHLDRHVLDRGADRGLSDRRRLSAVAGSDRLGF